MRLKTATAHHEFKNFTRGGHLLLLLGQFGHEEGVVVGRLVEMGRVSIESFVHPRRIRSPLRRRGAARRRVQLATAVQRICGRKNVTTWKRVDAGA